MRKFFTEFKSEFEEILDVVGEADEGIGEEAEEGGESMEPEEKEEFEKEVEKAKKNVEVLSKDARTFKDIMSSSFKVLKSFGIFVAKNAAIGAIFWGVNIVLTKLYNHCTDNVKRESYKKMLEFVKAITALINSETNLSKSIKSWLEQHKEDTVELDGIIVKVEAIFETHLKPISDAVDSAFKAARPLQSKINSKISWNVPTANDITAMIEASDSFYKAFINLREFATKHTNKVPSFDSLLKVLSQASLDELKNQLKIVKHMPFQ